MAGAIFGVGAMALIIGGVAMLRRTETAAKTAAFVSRQLQRFKKPDEVKAEQ